MPTSKKSRVCVLGAGCIGLSSAAAIAEALKDSALAEHVTITIVAKDVPPATTSDVAAGLWEPYDAVTEREVQWSSETLRWMQHVYRTREDAAEMGVFPCTVTTLSPASAAATAHAERARGARILSPEELELYGNPELSFGFRMESFVADTSRLLPWLVAHCRRRLGITIRRRSVQSLEQLGAEFDAVVNCCGLGAADLLGDTDIGPVRGQVVRVQAPWVKQAVVADLPDALAYVIPLTDFVVLGGLAAKGDWNRDVVAADTAAILERCGNLIPSLRRAKVLGAVAGLRPKRGKGVRLEAESVPLPGCRVGDNRVDDGRADVQHDDEQGGVAKLPGKQAASPGVGHRASTADGFGNDDDDDDDDDGDGDCKAREGAHGGGDGEQTVAERTELFVVHNYGHGGCGITMHRGCAREACDLLMRWLHKRHD